MQSQDDDGQQASAEKPKQLINEKQFNKICERLENGEIEIVGKIKESFVLTAQQELEINEILNK
jgi:hypothetical protein